MTQGKKSQKVSSLLHYIVFGFHNRYVPTHLQLMVFELVKNSLRAVQERYMDSDKVAPPVRIIVADGLEDVTIKAGSLLIYFKQFIPRL